MISSAAKSFDILATNLNVLYNYFNSLIKIIFRSSWIFRFFSKTILSISRFTKRFCWI